ncbi:MAG: hypothetical protein A2Y12_01425 [Planctomycetes bacterium GWF2_42_9]|nr:MAG: hypothetical protein A2Y12_01425 [Planctomycetes bacterium GWF2_42_9]
MKIQQWINAILYARFSPRRNEETCESIEAQFNYIRQYCAKHNVEIIAEFGDRHFIGGGNLVIPLFF